VVKDWSGCGHRARVTAVHRNATLTFSISVFQIVEVVAFDIAKLPFRFSIQTPFFTMNFTTKSFGARKTLRFSDVDKLSFCNIV